MPVDVVEGECSAWSAAELGKARRRAGRADASTNSDGPGGFAVPRKCLLDQPGLTDAGRTGNEHDAAIALLCRRHPVKQQFDVELPADKRPPGIHSQQYRGSVQSSVRVRMPGPPLAPIVEARHDAVRRKELAMHVRDCADKRGLDPGHRFIRVAARNQQDNHHIINALHDILHQPTPTA